MRLYYTDVLPTTPDLLTADQWADLAVDPDQRLSYGIGIYDQPLNQFQLFVWALENDNPLHPNQQREIPTYSTIPSGGFNYSIEFRGISYVPGTCPKQERKTTVLSGFLPIFTTIPQQDLAMLLDQIAPETDTTGFTTQDYYDHIIRDGGGGPQVRELLVDGRDLVF